MKGKAIARQGFCDLYQEDHRNGFSRPACIYRLAEAVRQRLGLACENYSAVKPKNRPSRGFSSSLVCSTVRQLSKSRRCFGNSGVVFSTTYDWRLNCHLSDTSCDGDEEPDAEDHQRGQRRSGL